MNGKDKNTKYFIIRRLISLALCMVMAAAFLPSCGSDEGNTSTDTEAYTEDNTEVTADESAGDTSQTVDASSLENEIDLSTLAGENGVDVDLTKLSATMVYSVVNDMMIHTDNYIGKKIFMSGALSVYHDENNGNTYYACIIKDATACCAQGIEFQTADGKYTGEEGDDITVVGIFDLHEEDGYQYCVLKDAEIV